MNFIPNLKIDEYELYSKYPNQNGYDDIINNSINDDEESLKSMILWRYIDFNKLTTFIKGILYFSRADSFEDKTECTTFCDSQIQSSNRAIMSLWEKRKRNSIQEDIKNEKENVKFYKQRKMYYNRNTYLSCWFTGQTESFLMWKAYTKIHNGFLIKVLAGDLINHLKEINYSKKGDVIYGTTKYMPYPFSEDNERCINAITTDTINIGSFNFEKFDFFIGENEFRFVIESKKKTINNRIKFKNIRIDLQKINSLEIFAHPKMDDWEFENYKFGLNKFGLDHLLNKSKIII